MRSFVFAAVFSVVLLSSCANKEGANSTAAPGGNAPHATVTLRDGTKATGTVVESSAAEIKLSGDDNITRTIPMTQVKSIDYGEAPATQAEAVPPPERTSPPPAAARLQREKSAPARTRQTEMAAAHEDHPHPSEAVITTKTYELPAGTELSVRTEEAIDSGKAVEGQTFAADITKDVLDANGDVVIPKGANGQIVIKSTSKGGRFRGASDLVLDLKSVSINGRQYQIDTVDVQQRGKSGIGANKRTAEYTGGGAALGAIIGAIAGGGKGAAIGAASGAGAGAVTQIVTKGNSIRVPVESVLTFKLDKPLRVVAAR
jgi:hypothetical protein